MMTTKKAWAFVNAPIVVAVFSGIVVALVSARFLDDRAKEREAAKQLVAIRQGRDAIGAEGYFRIDQMGRVLNEVRKAREEIAPFFLDKEKNGDPWRDKIRSFYKTAVILKVVLELGGLLSPPIEGRTVQVDGSGLHGKNYLPMIRGFQNPTYEGYDLRLLGLRMAKYCGSNELTRTVKAADMSLTDLREVSNLGDVNLRFGVLSGVELGDEKTPSRGEVEKVISWMTEVENAFDEAKGTLLFQPFSWRVPGC